MVDCVGLLIGVGVCFSVCLVVIISWGFGLLALTTSFVMIVGSGWFYAGLRGCLLFAGCCLLCVYDLGC